MTIISLSLKNFQGIKEKTFNFNGKNAYIYGDNGTGKTTVYNAFTWLLTGKASTGVKNYSPQTIGTHGLDHEVKGIFSEDSTNFELMKIYHEVWKKKKGSVTKELAGYSTDYYIDGVLTKEKDYNARVQEFFGSDDRIRCLTMPEYFAEGLSWEERRKILIDICGDISFEKVIEANEKLGVLPDLLEGHTVDEFKKIQTAREKDINRQLNSLPARIDEATKAIPDVIGTVEELTANRVSYQNTIDQLLNEKSELLASDSTQSLNAKKKAEIIAQIDEARHNYLLQVSESMNAYNKKHDKLMENISRTRKDESLLSMKIMKMNVVINNMKLQREECAKAWKQAHELVWEEENEFCPTCGQQLPADKIQTLKEVFNTRKSDALIKAKEEGQKFSKERISEKDHEKDNAEKMKIAKGLEIQELSEELKILEDNTPIYKDFEETDEYKALKTKLDEADTAKESDENSQEIQNIDSRIKDIEETLRKCNALLQAHELAKTQIQRIDELSEQQKELAKEYEDAERNIYLCDIFIKEKVRLLDENINSKFKKIRFKLFTEQVNGGIKDDCEVLVPCGDKLIPYRFANNAARINAGLEIIDTASKHWNIGVPVFIDNAEAVTKLAEYEDMQLIRLVVSEKDKELRMVID